MSEDAHDSFNDQYICRWDLTKTAVFSAEEVITLYKRGHIGHNSIEPLLRLSYEADGKLSLRNYYTDFFFTMEDVCHLKDLL